MPMTWDHEANVKLLLRILSTSDIKLDYKDLANHMGPEVTVIAIKRRIQRLRGIATADGDSSAPASPEKRKRGRGKKDANGDATGNDKASPKKAKKEENDSAVDDA